MIDILLLCITWTFIQLLLIRSMRPARFGDRADTTPGIVALNRIHSSV